jgi:hypothetical protein
MAALTLSAACLVAATPGTAAGDDPAARPGDRPDRWSGYRIRSTGDADGGWIGGYRVGDTTLFVVTPTKNPNRAGFETPTAVDDVAGRATSQSETERAAWILSKYGGYRDAAQAAAVDASVYHLLVGGKWKVGSPRGARRIRQSGDPASVRRFARIMLGQSRASAGAYTAWLDASGADLGGAVAVTLSVVDGHGRPAAGLPVTLAMGGSEPVRAVTGDDGRALGRFPADARGWQEVTATVDNVPDHRLHLWPAEKRRQAAAAEGGARRQLVVSTAAPVRGPQTLELRADPGQLVAGSSARVVAGVGGGDDSRTATAALHGPFASATTAGCSGAAVGAVSAPVTNDGSYPLPAVTVSGGGYYAWGVGVGGTATTMPVTACGATVKVLARPVTSVAWAPAAPAATENVSATASVSGIPVPARVQLRITFYQDPSCTTAVESRDMTRFGNGSVSSDFFVPNAGTYSWRAETSAGELWVGTTSPCRTMTTG